MGPNGPMVPYGVLHQAGYGALDPYGICTYKANCMFVCFVTAHV
jgi:hypothetical protein